MLNDFFIAVIISASGWFIGFMIARWILRKFFGPSEEMMTGGAISNDDILDFDNSDMPYIPVTVIKENGLYYAWFAGNDKFIGQAKKMDEICKMAHEHVLKQVGLRFEFTHEKDKTKPKPVT
jgi:hypothetical protein